MNMKVIIYDTIALLHQIIRSDIYSQGYIQSLRTFSRAIAPLLIAQTGVGGYTVKQIRKFVEYISNKDSNGLIVASCVSVSALTHLLCELSGRKSNIVIGVTVQNGKVYSHAWVELDNAEKIDFFNDGRGYKTIKRFSIKDTLC